MNDRKIQMLLTKEIWSKAIQKLIDKGVKPQELAIYTRPENRLAVIQVLASGEYRIAPPHVSLIPKDDGTMRKVYVNTVTDRLVLSMINEVYCEIYHKMIHPKCVSYQKGIGVKDILRKITRELSQNHSKGYKVDISKYFDSVDRETLNQDLKCVDSGSPVDVTLREYYNEDLIMDENNQVVEHYKSLAQGCAFAAFLANTTLRDVDAEMDKMCDVYYRYSDDILILGERSEEALAKLKEMLATKGLTINPKKISPVDENDWFTFLGANIKGNVISFSKKSINNIQKEVRERLPKKTGSEVELRRAIKRINNYLYVGYIKNSSQFGWGEYFFGCVNSEADIMTIDTWIKDALRASYTGKKKIGGLGVIKGTNYAVMRGSGRNVVMNHEKTRGMLERCGYISMHHMYKLYKMNKNVYRSEVAMMM